MSSLPSGSDIFNLDTFFSTLHPPREATRATPDVPLNPHDSMPAADSEHSRWDSLPHDVLHRLFQPAGAVHPGTARLVCRNWSDGVTNTCEMLQVADWPPKPELLLKFRALTSLDLTNCYFDPRSQGQMETILAQLAVLPALTKLYLSKESLVIKQSLRSRSAQTCMFYVLELPATISHLTSLQLLSIAPCSHHNRSSNITSVVEMPPELSQLTCLTSLKLFHVKQPLEFMGAPGHLLHIELTGAASIQAALPQLMNLTQLQHLTLDFKNVVKDVSGALRLQLLQQCSQLVSRLPYLTQLQLLNAREPSTQREHFQVAAAHAMPSEPLTLRPAAQQLQDPFLQVLDLSSWSPSFFCVVHASEGLLLPSLSHLSLANNKLNRLPEQLSRLTNLTYLDISHSNFVAAPSQLRCLTALQALQAPHNVMQDISSLSRLKCLKELDLSFNHIGSWGDDMSGLTALTKLDLGLNLIESLSPSIAQLRDLAYCDLQKNRLTSLPDGFSSLVRLTCLNLSHNMFAFIPDSLSGMTRLQELACQSQAYKESTVLERAGGASDVEATSMYQILYSQRHFLPSWLASLQDLQRLWIDIDPNIYSEVLNQLRLKGVKLNEQQRHAQSPLRNY